MSTNDKDIKDELAELRQSVAALNENVKDLNKEIRLLRGLILKLGVAIENN